MFGKSLTLPTAEQALPGREEPMKISPTHYVNGNNLIEPFPEKTQSFLVGMGCFWGAERKYWQTEGVFTTAVGYAGGHTKNPNYREVCSGKTGHNEVVLIVFDPDTVSFEFLLQLFWESHDPAQGMQQGNDVGTQYRSGIYVTSEQQLEIAQQTLQHYQQRLNPNKHGTITTEIVLNTPFYYAEDDHQQYLAKNPSGYCGIGGVGISYEV
jgi:peptide-methionine (S)-S-oxide reductase